MTIAIQTEEELLKEARRIIGAAKEERIMLRLLGGVAFRLKCPSSLTEKLKRTYQDIDFVGRDTERGKIRRFFARMGYVEPATLVNALNPYRIILQNPKNRINIDIFLDILEMSHKLDFRKRMALEEQTIPIADLLLSKLQAFEFTEREYKDVLALLKDYELTDNEAGVNVIYIARLCSKDWGLYTTIRTNLERLRERVDLYFPSPEDQSMMLTKLRRIEQIIENEPKSLRWKLRAVIGKRVKWYEIPEEIERRFEPMFK